MRESAPRTLAFTALVCGVCSVLVSATAVGLRERQEKNRTLDRRAHVLRVAGLREHGESLSPDEIARRFEAVEARVVDLREGTWDRHADPQRFDMRDAMRDPSRSRPAPRNPAGLARLPLKAPVYLVRDGAEVTALVLPIEGKGLWSTLRGYLALSGRDAATILGITFYEHGETPGLGAQVEDPKWQEGFRGRQVFDSSWQPAVRVARGAVGSPEEDPHRVDGISGATITGDAVTAMLHLWLGDDGFGPWLQRYRRDRGIE